MSLSTTSSAAYILTKYSRSYSSANSRPAPTENDWQHFTNPTIRLVLDIRKTRSGELESYRMRVVWSIDSEPNMMDVDHREVTFEDIDLLSFSKINNLQNGKVNGIVGDAGLPLKAVYRDCVVGFRYLHPLHAPQSQNPTYRRIQVNFKSSLDASNFIDTIRQVCPCKENPPARARASTMVQYPDSQANPHSDMPPPPVPHLSGSRSDFSQLTEPQRAPHFSARASTMVEAQSPGRSAYFSTVLNESASRNAALMSLPKRTIPSTDLSGPVVPGLDGYFSTVARANENLNLPSRHPEIPSSVSTSSPPLAPVHEESRVPSATSHDLPACAPVLMHQSVPATVPGTSHAPSSYPQASPPTKNPLNSAPIEATLELKDNSPELLTTLRNIPTLYELPAKDLEILVAQVVREDGFVELLEKLDTLWRMKGLLGLI